MEKFCLVVASDKEYDTIKNLEEYSKLLERKEISVIKMGIGATNVIESLKDIDKKTKLINIGYAGSNLIPVGSIVKVKNCLNYHPNAGYNYYEKTYELNGDIDCYTSSDFVTQTNFTNPVVFDMELSIICALGFNVESYKIVSDCLNITQYEQANFIDIYREVLLDIYNRHFT